MSVLNAVLPLLHTNSTGTAIYAGQKKYIKDTKLTIKTIIKNIGERTKKN